MSSIAKKPQRHFLCEFSRIGALKISFLFQQIKFLFSSYFVFCLVSTAGNGIADALAKQVVLIVSDLVLRGFSFVVCL